MRIDEIESRKAEIREMLKAEDTSALDIDALTEEVRSLDTEKAEIEERNAKEAQLRSAVAPEVVAEIKENMTEKKEERKMDIKEIRNSAEYINAYAEYIKTGKDAECRALLSTNGTDATSPALTGYVPVPEYIEGRVRTAWEKNEIMSLVRKTYLRGNVKVGFELSATGAVVHKEGRDAPDEEVITLGIVTMIPQSIKKWITVSDEALDLAGEEFLNYIYDELTYRIAKKAEEILIDMIAALPDTATSTSVSAQVVEAAPAVDTIAKAIGKVKGDGEIVIAMNRGTWSYFKTAQYEANFPIDPFEGRRVVYTEALPSYLDANDGDVYAIVGDFRNGAQANFPNGDEISLKTDALSLAEKDLVKFVGREYVGLGVTGMDAFALVIVP